MRVTLKNGESQQEIFINWRYIRSQIHGKDTIETYCNVFTPTELLSVGRTYVHSNDVFVKKEGRKRSLTKALTNMSKLSKTDRTEIWNQYKIMIRNKF